MTRLSLSLEGAATTRQSTRSASLQLSCLLLAVGCSSASATASFEDAPADAGPDDPANGRDAADGDAGAAPDAAAEGGAPEAGSVFDGAVRPLTTLGPRTKASRLVSDAQTVAGVTEDGQIVYRASDGLFAIPANGEGERTLITPRSGPIEIRRNTVFFWADVDWTAMSGQLVVWTAKDGPRQVGTAVFGEAALAVSEDGTMSLYYTDLKDDTLDLMIASAGGAEAQPLIVDVGRGSEETCRASAGFALNAPVVGWCAAGTTEARIERFESKDGAWAAQSLATEVRPTWSTDESGQRFLFIGTDSRASFFDGSKLLPIDTSVGWGMLLPGGSSVLYTVGDQLRRTPVPDTDPVAVVVNDFIARSQFDPRWERVLYSTELTYEGTTRRDLYMVETSGENRVATRLVEQPTAALPESAFTPDGKYVLYLEDITNSGSSTLAVRSVDTATTDRFQDVDTVLTGADNRIVFTSARSAPDTYPITADLNVALPGGEMRTLRPGVSSGRDITLTPDTQSVVYVMPRGADPDQNPEGLYTHLLP